MFTPSPFRRIKRTQTLAYGGGSRLAFSWQSRLFILTALSLFSDAEPTGYIVEGFSSGAGGAGSEYVADAIVTRGPRRSIANNEEEVDVAVRG